MPAKFKLGDNVNIFGCDVIQCGYGATLVCGHRGNPHLYYVNDIKETKQYRTGKVTYQYFISRERSIVREYGIFPNGGWVDGNSIKLAKDDADA